MIGRLVEDQQVHRFQQQLDHGQAGALTAREHLHFLVDILPAKHEGSQAIPYFRTDVTHRDVVDGLKDRQLLLQQRCLVLCEVTDLHVVPQLQATVESGLPHDAFDKGRFPLTVAAHEGHLLTPFNHEVDIAEDQLLIVRLAETLRRHRIAARAWGRGEAQLQCRGVHLIHLHQFQLLQHLYARLHLECLGVGAFKPLDKLLRLGNHLLLVVILLLLLLTALAAKIHVVRVGSLVIVDPSHGHLDGAVGDVVHEGPVV